MDSPSQKTTYVSDGEAFNFRWRDSWFKVAPAMFDDILRGGWCDFPFARGF